jgi:hypothetical protein
MQQRFNKPPCCCLLCIKDKKDTYTGMCKVPRAFYIYIAHCEVKVQRAILCCTLGFRDFARYVQVGGPCSAG